MGDMKITLKDEYRVRDLVSNIQKKSRKEGMCLIYEWVMIQHIDLGVFQYLISVLPMTEEENEYEE